MLVGGDSPDNIKANPETVGAALPDARISVLDGQQHVAIDLVPEVSPNTSSRPCATSPKKLSL
jgi:hypothetical protein